MRIGELARHTGTTIDTLRHYERLGLLQPVRADNGYRRYGASEVDAVQLIRRVQRLGFTLSDIRDVLPRLVAGRLHCAVVAGRLDAKLAALDAQIAQLRALRQEVADLRAQVTNDAEATVRLGGGVP